MASSNCNLKGRYIQYKHNGIVLACTSIRIVTENITRVLQYYNSGNLTLHRIVFSQKRARVMCIKILWGH